MYQTTTDELSKQIGNVLVAKDIPGYKDAGVDSLKRNDDGNTDIDLRISFADGTEVDSTLKENVKGTIQHAVNNNDLQIANVDKYKPVTLIQEGLYLLIKIN